MDVYRGHSVAEVLDPAASPTRCMCWIRSPVFKEGPPAGPTTYSWCWYKTDGCHFPCKDASSMLKCFPSTHRLSRKRPHDNLPQGGKLGVGEKRGWRWQWGAPEANRHAQEEDVVALRATQQSDTRAAVIIQSVPSMSSARAGLHPSSAPPALLPQSKTQTMKGSSAQHSGGTGLPSSPPHPPSLMIPSVIEALASRGLPCFGWHSAVCTKTKIGVPNLESCKQPIFH